MKTISVFFLAFFFSVTVAIAQDTLYVYQAGAVAYKSVITAVDSVTFHKVYAPPATVTDKDGNVYHSVTIGTQTWMVENLKTTKYRNGESITNPTADADWAAAGFGAWCDYENTPANGTKYGHLYNWYAVNDNRNIAPVGWHVASDAEWTTLENYVSANLGTSLNVAKALAATTDWATYSSTGTVGNNPALNNATGFSALPGGYRISDGAFNYQGTNGHWWSCTETNTSLAWYRNMYYSNSYVGRANYGVKADGFSVRCVKDNVPTLSATTPASAITTTTATSGGDVTSDGASTITARGICWSTATAPTTALSTKTTETGTTGVFTSAMTNLTAGTKYYVRAYATNTLGTSYGSEVSFTTLDAPVDITDIDGNVYHSVTIGTQTWMVENLKTTKYRDGESITNPTAVADWAAAGFGAWCDYENTPANGTKYGHLYNWYAVNDNRNIAPVGWHVPTDAEWTTLINYVSANLGTSLSVAKALAATTDWTTDSGSGTIGNNLALNNATSFSALPGGYRDGDGSFSSLGIYGNWWSSTEYSTSYAWCRTMNYGYSDVYRGYGNKASGFSVRCVRD